VTKNACGRIVRGRLLLEVLGRLMDALVVVVRGYQDMASIYVYISSEFCELILL